MSLFKKKKQDEDSELPEQTSENPETSDDSDNSENPDNSENSENSDISQSSQSSQSSRSSQSSHSSHEHQAPYDPLLPFLTQLATELESGLISDDTRRLLTNALNYDADMIRARTEGELAGRNAAVEEHLMGHDNSDGVPHPGCGQGASTTVRPFSIFDLARDARM